MIYSRSIPAGVSACVYGCRVRYNGKGWNLVERIGREREMFVFHIYCPEVAAGLGVPRRPIRLKKGNGKQVWEDTAQVVQAGGRDVTEAMKQSVQAVVDAVRRDGIRVYFHMEGSPTCGVTRTSNRARGHDNPPGLLGQRLLEEGVFLIPAQVLQSPIQWWDWRRRMLAFLWLQEQSIASKEELYAIWHQVKFLCQEIDEPAARTLGHLMANLGQTDSMEPLRERMLDILRKPSTSKRIQQWLWKHYSHVRKKHGITVDGVLEPDTPRGATHLAQEMRSMEIELYRKGLSFSSSPVLWRRS